MPRRPTASRIRRLVREHEEEERPFDPGKAPTWRGTAHDLVANPVPRGFRGPVELFMYDEVENRWQSCGREPNIRAAEQEIRNAAAAGIEGAKWSIERIGGDPNLPGGGQHEFRLNASGFRTDLRELVDVYRPKLRTTMTADNMVKKLAEAFRDQSTEDALVFASGMLEGHGVEALGGSGDDGPAGLYINFGDTYDPTIVWLREGNKVFVAMGGWGDVLTETIEPDQFQEGWDNWLASDFNHQLEEEAISLDPDHEDDEPVPGGAQERALELIESDEGTQELFRRALSRAANAPRGGMYPEVSYESDGSLFVRGLPAIVREAAAMLAEGWTPGTFEGHAKQHTPNARPRDARQQQVLEAIRSAAAKGGSGTGRAQLADVRERLSGFPRSEQDRLLLEMQRERLIVLYQNDNRAEVTARDRAAAIYIGPHPRHIVYELHSPKLASSVPPRGGHTPWRRER